MLGSFPFSSGGAVDSLSLSGNDPYDLTIAKDNDVLYKPGIRDAINLLELCFYRSSVVAYDRHVYHKAVSL